MRRGKDNLTEGTSRERGASRATRNNQRGRKKTWEQESQELWEGRISIKEWPGEKDQVNEKKKFSIKFGTRKFLIPSEGVVHPER